jgi:hypothetical protein
MMKKESRHLNIARYQFAATGLTVLDSSILATADPTQWPSVQQEMLERLAQKSLIASLYTSHPTAIFFEFRVSGGGYVGMTRSLVNIEDRIESLIGVKASGIKTFTPGSTLHAETSRIPEMKQQDSDEFAAFDPEAFERSLPRHDCHVRHEGIAKLARYRARQEAQAA